MPADDPTTVALLGSTGKLGGWVLEALLDGGYQVRALVRQSDKLQAYADRPNLTVLQGSSDNEETLSELIDGCSAIIATLGSPDKDTLVCTPSAKALVSAIKKRAGSQPAPRIIWSSSEGVNNGKKQAQLYGCADNCLPSCNCFGWGFFGFMQYFCIIPFVISHAVWDDMATAEDALTSDEDIHMRTVIARPTIFGPISEAKAFSDEWRSEGGDQVGYMLKAPSDKPPGIYINKKSIAKFLVDAVTNEEWDGKEPVHLFQGA